ncbi:MAG: PAS domain S-box protein, partial [Desulfobaccales bacterium]
MSSCSLPSQAFEAAFRRLAESYCGLGWIVALARRGPRLLYVSPATEPFWKWAQDTIQEDVSKLLEIMHPEDSAFLGKVWSRLLAGDTVSGEVRLAGPQGEEHAVAFQAFFLDPENSPPGLLAGFCREPAPCPLSRPAEATLAWEARVNAALAELSQAVITSAPPVDLSRLVLFKAKELTGSDRGSVAYVDCRSRELVFPDLGEEASERGQFSAWLQESLVCSARWARCLAERQPLLINEPRPPAQPQERPASHRRYLCVPAVFQDRLLGHISLATELRDYETRDLLALERLASLFAVALERQQAEEALREKEERFRSLVEAISDLVWETDADGRLTFISPNVAELLGYSPEDVLGKTFLELLPPGENERVGEMLSPILEGKKPYVYVGKLSLHKCGRRVVLESSAVPILDSQGVFRGYRGIDRDITVRHRAEAALRESEAKYRLLVSNIPAVVFRGYADWSVEVFDDKVEELTGYAKEDFNSGRLKWSDLILPEDFSESQRIFRQALQTTGAYVRQYRIRHKQGHTLWIQARGQIIQDRASRIDHVYGVFFDITKQKQVEQDLAAEKERLGVTLRSIGEGVIATDTEGKVVLMNQVAEALTGWTQEEARHQPVGKVLSLIHEITRKPCDTRVEQVIRTGNVVSLPAHTLLQARDGAERILAASAAPIIDEAGQVIGVVLVFQDITLKRQTDAELLKMEKLTSLGILAGGIAHDFNNILTGILGNISLALLSSAQQGEVFRRLSEAEQATLRARDLVQQLLTFAKGGAPVKEVASLGEIIKDSATFACRGSQVRCDFTWPQGLWPAEVDQSQISQVIQNLVINAIQAMPTGGAIAIGAENITLREDQGLPLPPGKYIKIEIKDQGIGIPPDYLPKIFDPYFSTKQKGSGLGLATAYSIIKNH